jgi:hypothetical protein
LKRGDQDQNDLRKHWNIAYPDAAIKPIFLKKVDKYLSEKSRRIRPFEAADLIGYENLLTHKRLDKLGRDTIPFEDLRKPMQRLSRMPGADKWGYFSKLEMLSTCQKWSIPAR